MKLAIMILAGVLLAGCGVTPNYGEAVVASQAMANRPVYVARPARGYIVNGPYIYPMY